MGLLLTGAEALVREDMEHTKVLTPLPSWDQLAWGL